MTRARKALGVSIGGILALVVSCSRTDGSPLDPSTLGLQACTVDLDCGPGRHCGASKNCEVACVTSADCGYSLADPNAVNDLVCSPCGSCVAKDVRDSRCLSAVDQPCATSQDCQSTLGADYTCGSDGLCARTCSTDTDCSGVGRGWGCGTKNVCIRSCFRASDCWYHGWAYSCELPAGVDPKANEDSATPVFGECKKGTSPFVPTTPSDPPSARYQGTWGFIATSATVVDNVPIVTQLDSVNIQHMLVKIVFNGADLAMTMKWCLNTVKNFNNNDGPVFNLFNVVVPDRNVDAINVGSFTAVGVPTLAPGAAFLTTPLVDVRGARGLADPVNGALPSYKDPTNQWDQDRDGQPGMTVNVTGSLTGDLYQAQRWVVVFHATVVDEDHMQGLAPQQCSATVLGATKPELVNDSVASPHPDGTRSYFRALRLADDASCDDVALIANTQGSFIAYSPHLDPTVGVEQ